MILFYALEYIMIYLRKSQERGKTHTDWLDSYHTFSFANYFDPYYVNFGQLRVINEDTVSPGKGFPTHAHHDMEIISYVVDGVMEHRDSMGNGSLIKPGEIQRMTAGTGIRHSEFNSSKIPLHLLQIWIQPNKNSLNPSYEQKKFNKIPNQLILIGAEHGNAESVSIHQDIKLYVAFLTKDFAMNYTAEKGRLTWIQLIHGIIEVNNQLLLEGDGVAINDERKINIVCKNNAELLLFDLGRS